VQKVQQLQRSPYAMHHAPTRPIIACNMQHATLRIQHRDHRCAPASARGNERASTLRLCSRAPVSARACARALVYVSFVRACVACCVRACCVMLCRTEKRSESEFCTGVPVTHHRRSAESALTAWAGRRVNRTHEREGLAMRMHTDAAC
jgi:hypothetical protein